MKFIAFSDLHIHNYKRFDNNGSRLENCLKVLDIVFQAAYDESIKVILFTGDLFDSQRVIPVEVINKTVKRFDTLFKMYPDIVFIAISGNHDNTSDVNGKSALIFLADLFQNFELIDNSNYTIVRKNKHPVIIQGVPYCQYPKTFFENLKGVGVPEHTILLMHQTPSEISNKNILTDFSIAQLKDFKLVLSGHIHKPERLSDNCLMLGSPLHRDLGDIYDEKGYWLIDIDNQLYNFMPIKGFPVFITTQDDGFNFFVNTNKEIHNNLLNSVEDSELIEAFDVSVPIDILIENYCSIEFPDNPAYLEIGLQILNS